MTAGSPPEPPESSQSPRRRVAVATAVAAVVLALVVVAAGAVAIISLNGRYEVPSADLFGAGTASPSARPSPTPPPPGAEITGPLNLLLVGIDPRPSQPAWQPHADAVLILHVPERLDRAYLFSLPRDLILEIPAFPPADFGGGTHRLLAAMTYGSRVPGQRLPDPAQGFALLAETVSGYTGIERFDAGAVLNFGGFSDLVDALGGVEVWLDRRVASEHREPDGSHRELRPGGGGYLGPQRVYEPGTHHLVGWEALDLARQRRLPRGDYDRQQHQRRLIQALVEKVVDQELATDPVRLDRVLRAVGDALVFDGRGYAIADFGYALRRLRADRIETVDLPGRAVHSGGGYRGEELRPEAGEFLEAVRDDRVDEFLADHPELRDPRAPRSAGPRSAGPP